MSRWIDADALDYKFEETFDEEKMEYLKPNTFADGAVWVMRRIAKAPSIDIVRCKECKRFGDEGWCFWRDVAIKPDDFCSYGERAEQTEPKCDECLHFDRTYKERGEDGVLVIGVECDGMDKICDKFSTIDCAWK